MGKVIDFYTRKEITEMPHSKQEGEMLIEALLQFELKRASNPFSSTAELVSNVISIVENSTGASRYEVMERIYAEKKA